MESAEKGYLHLTPKGWVRHDNLPYPEDRVETWLYEKECPAEDAKERVCLTRVWINEGFSARAREKLRFAFGEPLAPSPDRNVTLECLV